MEVGFDSCGAREGDGGVVHGDHAGAPALGAILRNAGFHLLSRDCGKMAAPGVGDPAGLEFEDGKVGAAEFHHAGEGEIGEIGVEGEVEEIGVAVVDGQLVADFFAEEGKVEFEAGAEEDGVYGFGGSVDEADLVARDLFDPGLDLDAAFGNEREKMLAEGYAGFEDVVRRFECAVLFGAAAVGDDELFEGLGDGFHGKGFHGERAVAGHGDVIGGDSCQELEEDITLVAIGGDHLGCSKHGEVAGDFQRADGTADYEQAEVAIFFGMFVIEGVGYAAFAGEVVEAGDRGDGRFVVAAGGDDDVREDFFVAGAVVGFGADAPAFAGGVVGDLIDSGVEVDRGCEVELVGVLLEVGVHLLIGGVDGGSGRVREVAEAGHDAAGVGAHGWPDSAGAGRG